MTIEIANADYNKLIPPYNPFIICSTDQGRGKKEVHLVNYPPTDKADNNLWSTGEDASQPEHNLFYVSNDNMPFAIHLPDVKDFPVPAEKVRITTAYPGFAEWVRSSGAQNKDWYLHKNE